MAGLRQALRTHLRVYAGVTLLSSITSFETRIENFGRLRLDRGNKSLCLLHWTMSALLFSARPRQFYLSLPFSLATVAGGIFSPLREKESAKCERWVHCCTLHRPGSDAASPRSSPLRL